MGILCAKGKLFWILFITELQSKSSRTNLRNPPSNIFSCCSFLLQANVKVYTNILYLSPIKSFLICFFTGFLYKLFSFIWFSVLFEFLNKDLVPGVPDKFGPRKRHLITVNYFRAKHCKINKQKRRWIFEITKNQELACVYDMILYSALT